MVVVVAEAEGEAEAESEAVAKALAMADAVAPDDAFEGGGRREPDPKSAAAAAAAEENRRAFPSRCGRTPSRRRPAVPGDDREHRLAVVRQLLRANALDPSERGEIVRARISHRLQRLVVEHDVRGLAHLLRHAPAPTRQLVEKDSHLGRGGRGARTARDRLPAGHTLRHFVFECYSYTRGCRGVSMRPQSRKSLARVVVYSRTILSHSVVRAPSSSLDRRSRLGRCFRPRWRRWRRWCPRRSRRVAAPAPVALEVPPSDLRGVVVRAPRPPRTPPLGRRLGRRLCRRRATGRERRRGSVQSQEARPRGARARR